MSKTRINQDDIEDKAERQKDELEMIAENAGRYARKMLNETHHLGESADALKAAICQDPIKASLIALGVGALLGIIIRR